MTQWGLDNLFNPGKRHMDDEKRRLQSTREEIGDSSGGKRIDFESGRVAINVPGSATDADADTDTDTDTDVSPGDELDAALEAEDVPAVALANDEAEIVPELVDEPAVAATSHAEPEPDVGPEPEPEAEADPEPVVTAAPKPAPVADDVPIEAPVPEPVVAAVPRRKLSASDWARRG